MPLETATYIDDLDSANPASGDGLSQADDHLRLLKSTIKNTFPNIAGAVNATHTEINTAVDQSDGTTAHVIPLGTVGAPGIGVVGDTNTGVYSPAADQLAVAAGGTQSAKFTATGMEVPGTLAVTGALSGGTGQLVPTGTVLDYAGATEPTGFLFCYGQAISRATYAALFAVLGTTYGSGDGTTTFNVPDLRGRVIAGQDDMGGVSADRLTGAAGGVNGDTLGAAGGAETHALTEAQLATHTHTASVTDPGHTHTVVAPVSRDKIFVTTDGVPSGDVWGDNSGGSSTTESSQSATTGITVSNANTGSGSAHNNVQPTLVLNKIIKT
jgi:microcystin-dependent protein